MQKILMKMIKKYWESKQARDKYRNLSEVEKNEKGKYGRKICHNISEE